MSASPADIPNGKASATSRKKLAANPLRMNRRPALPPTKPRPRPAPTSSAATQAPSQVNGVTTGPPTAGATLKGSAPTVRDASLGFVKARQSPDPPGEPLSYPVVMSRSDLIEGLRFHLVRFQAGKDRKGERMNIDIRNEQDFTRPIRLHRRDPQNYATPLELPPPPDSKEALLDDKEREKREAEKAERQRIREEQTKLIAPNVVAKKKPQAFKKKTEQVYRANDTPEQQKRSLLRYEEALPWHIEDDDNKSVWQGMYEAALSENHVMLIPNNTGSFRLYPVEKFYRFKERTSTKHAKQYTIDEAEALMKKRVKEPRWVTETQSKQKESKQKEQILDRRLYGRRGGRDEREGGDGEEVGEEAPDADDIDFDAQEEFADDEENPVIEGDEETQKDAEDRIRKEQLGANVFDKFDEKEVDEEFEKERLKKRKEKEEAKAMQKMLYSKEKRADYERDDSDRDPFASSSESEDEENEEAKENEAENGEQKKPEDTEVTSLSAAALKAANTPTGREEKRNNLLKPNNLKRPGSPGISDVSGSESAQKRQKLAHLRGLSAPGPRGSGDEGRSRQSSLGPKSLAKDALKRTASARGAAGSGSDSDRADGKKAAKIMLRFGSSSNSPQNSRASSPSAPGAGTGITQTVSRPKQSGPSTPSSNASLPSESEILNHVPAAGITIQELTTRFRNKIDPSQVQEFSKVVRGITIWDPATKLLRPKP